jgi:hypothetical protein
MNNRNYTKKELIEADEYQFSFLVGVNLVNTSELLLQFPFELFKTTKKGWGRKKDLEIYQLFAAFQSIVNAVELLLKSRIALINYKLLLKTTKNISRELIINGDFQSINFDKCIEVIECNSADSIPKNIKDRVDSLRIIRNKITHYYIETTQDMFLNYIAFGLDAYITIYRDFIKEKIYDSYDRTEGFEEELSDFEQFVKIRVEKYKEDHKLENYKIPGNPECPICYTWNLVIQENKKMCLFCGYEEIDETET